MSDDSLRQAVNVNDTVEVQVGAAWVEAKVKKTSNTDIQVDFTTPSGVKKTNWMARKDKRWRIKTGGASSTPSYSDTPTYDEPEPFTPEAPTSTYTEPSRPPVAKSKKQAMGSNEANIVRMPPGYFCHIFDNNSLITKLILGPTTQTLLDQEEVVYGPEAYIVVPPRSYCIIQNPVVRDNKKNPIQLTSGLYKVKYGEQEIRFQMEPFPLYPGESLSGAVQRLEVISPLQAIHLRAVRDLADGKTPRLTGDEWLFIGPGTYYPRVEVQTVKTVNATIIKPGQALKMRVSKDCIDAKANPRISGEEWIVKEVGPYLPGVYEEIVAVVNAYSLTKDVAIHLTATRTFVDAYKKERKAGEEWLLTNATVDLHIPDVSEKVIGEVKIQVLNSRQYCVVLDPYDPIKQKVQLGKREVRTGVISFFLHPGESLEKGIQSTYVLKEDEALLLCARELYKDGQLLRKAGDRWMIYGPRDYVPTIEVDVIEKRRTIALGDNEGIYVRNMNTGEVNPIIGKCYMLKPHEELWEKQLPDDVESLLDVDALSERTTGVTDLKQSTIKRDKTRVVSYRVASNSAVQIFDYKKKTNRVSFGPDFVLLGPNEVFTVLSLSGGRPKQENHKKSLVLLLGPDFMTDEFVVETADHARLTLSMAYNWKFDINVNKYTPKEAEQIFSINDFVGMACRGLASRIRGAIARTPFDTFHKHSATLIQQAVFSKEEDSEEMVDSIKFSNLLAVTGIDIQSVEPTDTKTRDALLQSVQQAIEITTKSQEMSARHEAERREQAAKGVLDLQRLSDMAEAENSRKSLLTIKAQSVEIEATGRALASAKAVALSKEIEAQAQVAQTLSKTQVATITAQSELEVNKSEWSIDLSYKTQLYELEIKKKKTLNLIETKKFQDLVAAIGVKNITEMAEAGPEAQCELLKALGIKSILLTDSTSPINIFNTSDGLVTPATGVTNPI